MKRFAKSGLLALVLLLLLTTTIWAEETICVGSLGPVTVDNLRVPQHGSCTLDGTKVEGTIKVENNASLTARTIQVIGNIQAEGAALVNVLANSTVGGSIQLKQGGSARIDQVEVSGDIQFESNNGVLGATRNQVGGNVQVFQNNGGVTIADNVIDGNLQCKENNPPPTGGNNVVDGNKEDQCANLVSLDLTPPESIILDGPAATTIAIEATFIFTGSDNATSSSLLVFECALDGAAFEACLSPHTVQGLTVGEHQFRVRVLDLALNVDPTPAGHIWTVEPLDNSLTWKLYLPFVGQGRN